MKPIALISIITMLFAAFSLASDAQTRQRKEYFHDRKQTESKQQRGYGTERAVKSQGGRKELVRKT